MMWVEENPAPKGTHVRKGKKRAKGVFNKSRHSTLGGVGVVGRLIKKSRGKK